ncbi:hypothetical protein C8R42DRAFT_716088 [Lentinula raphanica]|nr:hypothetical protein C8R42DRAFT_716088 [Lentinula raphanica]
MAAPPSSGQWMRQIVTILNNNGLTSWDFIHNILQFGTVFSYTIAHRECIIEHINELFELLLRESAISTQQAAAKTMIETYRNEIVGLVERERGFHFNATTATLEQLESFAIENLAARMQSLCPFLSDLLDTLLDANHSYWRRVQYPNEESDSETSVDQENDEAVRMDSDSDEERDNELQTEPEAVRIQISQWLLTA